MPDRLRASDGLVVAAVVAPVVGLAIGWPWFFWGCS